MDPVAALDAELGRRLADLDRAGLRRTVAPPHGLDFSSNDYLGLAADPELRRRTLDKLEGWGEAPIGAPSSRLLRGHDERHAALERRLAAFKGQAAALLFPSGYQANVGLLTALLEPGDRAISDVQNHASLIDGLRLSGCAKTIVPHRDLGAIERALDGAAAAGERAFLITESLFSMDGDVAPLDRYADLCARFGGHLIVDDAHATGLFGARGSGLVEAFGVERRTAAVLSTFGKALGLAGACVSGSATLIDHLVQRSRAFIFSTAPPPLLLAGIEAALDLVAARPERRLRALELAARLRARLTALGVDALASAGPIVPVVLGDNRRAVAAGEALRARGFDVRAVRPPTVPAGTARLRVSVHADRTEAEVDALAAALAEICAPNAAPTEAAER